MYLLEQRKTAFYVTLFYDTKMRADKTKEKPIILITIGRKTMAKDKVTCLSS